VLLTGAFAVFVGAAAGLDFSVRVGAAVALAEVVPVVVGDGLDVVDADVADGLVGVADGLLGVADGLLGVADELLVVADGEVGVGEGDWVGGAAGSWSGSHD
jgi:hypothetical protein